MLKKELIKKLAEEGFDKKIVDAFKRVNREDFVPIKNKKLAYSDEALPIGYGQTISQPYTIAFMLSLLEVCSAGKLMEVGSGSGYALALLNTLTFKGEIYGVEKILNLVERSRTLLNNYKNIKVFQANKRLGLPELAPFDRILVSASSEEIPSQLVNQLADGGILVCPVKNDIIKIQKKHNKYAESSYYGFSFVPLIYSYKNL